MTAATQSTGAAAGKKKPAPKRKPGRPTRYTEAIADEIVLRLSTGETLRSICRDEHIAAWQTVYEWMDRNEEFSRRVARAREVGHEAIAERTLHEMQQAPAKCDTQFGKRVDAGYVQWQKNKAEHALKLLACWNPRKYGQKQTTELTGMDGAPISVAAAVAVVTLPDVKQVQDKIKQKLGLK